MAQLMPLPNKIFCILCNGVVSLGGTKERFRGHMKYEHEAQTGIDFLLAGCLMTTEERKVVEEIMEKKYFTPQSKKIAERPSADKAQPVDDLDKFLNEEEINKFLNDDDIELIELDGDASSSPPQNKKAKVDSHEKPQVNKFTSKAKRPPTPPEDYQEKSQTSKFATKAK